MFLPWRNSTERAAALLAVSQAQEVFQRWQQPGFFPVQFPAASLPLPKTSLVPKDKSASITKYQPCQSRARHFSESHVKTEGTIIKLIKLIITLNTHPFEKTQISLPGHWGHQTTFHRSPFILNAARKHSATGPPTT